MTNDEWLQKYIERIDHRLDSVEHKVDQLLEFKWKIAGMAIFVGVIGAAVFQLINSYIQAKGG